MRLARVAIGREAHWAVLEGDEVILARDAFAPGGPVPTGAVAPGEARLLAPIRPSKVIAVGLNYRDHARELDMAIPEEPVLFMKPPSSVIGPGDAIIMPPRSSQVDYEAELAIVIRAVCKDVPVSGVGEVVLGYTCGNDVTARDLQGIDGQWTRAKGFDTFCPLGPWIETDLDPSSLKVQALVDGHVRQSGSTADMIFGVAELVSFISGVMTLEPGDVILSGTPPGVGPLAEDEVIAVRIEGIGELANPVARHRGATARENV